MTNERYTEADNAGKLTPEEVTDGWHFCMELDGALVNTKDVSEFCRCFEEDDA